MSQAGRCLMASQAGGDMTDIQMIGIDHSTAGVKIREQFSFTASQAGRAMLEIKTQPDIRGCVLLSTCNRMELYVSMKEGRTDLYELLYQIRQKVAGQTENGQKSKEPAENGQKFRKYFKGRKGKEAVRHLFYLTCGLRSRVLGEDQILAQVKEAAQKAREIYCTDTLLEVLFRYAVTAGKEVRTKAAFVHADLSAVHCAVNGLKRQGYEFAGKKCLVIGNGQMGKLAAGTLRDEGAFVTVTVRQYRSGMVEIPKDCERIHYGERYGQIPDCDLIVSATVSPNLTIRKEQLAQARGGRIREQIYIDLAVPRDMEEGIRELEGVTLYDIDSFQSDAVSEEMVRQQKAAEQILEQKLAQFWEWQECRGLVPRIQQIGQRAAEDICWRMGSGLKQFSEEEQEIIGKMVTESSQKVVDRMLFALRDELGAEELERCVEVLERLRF